MSDEQKLLALFRIIDDPDGWWDSLNYQQQILCKGWLLTGNRLFADALLNQMLPEQVIDSFPVAPVKRLSYATV